jgi:hypothetical protein
MRGISGKNLTIIDGEDDLIKEFEEFKSWKRKQKKSDFDKVFNELEDLMINPRAKAYNSVMPVRAFRIMAEALMAIKEELGR